MAALLPLFRHASRLTTAATDRELLTRFASQRDEDAFAELVHRHGPVVYRICCRLVGTNAAEDAFQAVFLVLATRLPAACAAKSVSGWLVGVAGRVARQMQRASRRRIRHESAAAESRPAEWMDQTTEFTDQFRVLDEELAQLPDYLRDPVVLCILQGHTQEQAALELGRDARTLRRRLERAKQVLRARLERRGVLPAVATALVVGAGEVSATVPNHLTSRTVATVFNFLTGGTAAACSPPVVLAKGVAKTMLARKLMHLMVGATLGLVGLGVVFAGDGPPGAVAAPPSQKAVPYAQWLPDPPRAIPAPPPPTPVQPIVVPPSPPVQALTPPQPVATANAPDIHWANDEARKQKINADLRQNLEAGERVVLIEGLCVRASAGFCTRSGLNDEESVKGVWVITPRERRMLSALFRAEKSLGTLEIISQPMITSPEGQKAVVEIKQPMEVVTGLEAETKNGKTVYTAKTSKVDVGVTLNVTPEIAPSGNVQLKIEAQGTELATLPVQVPVTASGYPFPLEVPPAFVVGRGGANIYAHQTTVVLLDAGTVVLRSAVPIARGTQPDRELIWVLTAHVVRTDKKATSPSPPAPKPTPIAPVRP